MRASCLDCCGHWVMGFDPTRLFVYYARGSEVVQWNTLVRSLLYRCVLQSRSRHTALRCVGYFNGLDSVHFLKPVWMPLTNTSLQMSRLYLYQSTVSVLSIRGFYLSAVEQNSRIARYTCECIINNIKKAYNSRRVIKSTNPLFRADIYIYTVIPRTKYLRRGKISTKLTQDEMTQALN